MIFYFCFSYFLDKDLLLRVPDVFLTLSAVYAIMQLIGLIVVCDPPEKMRSSGLGSVSEYLRGMRHGRSANPRQRFSAVLYKQLPREEITVLGRKLHVPDWSVGSFGIRTWQKNTEYMGFYLYLD
ncbi:hypothetical protein ANCDUO_18083 [Ancylostoma duodenale]|uniref:Uncharacterized protein n=1 Tax=Ancylostoma duodenale TaxID=51022 RepID=A0A0C2FYS4_9BILA|nr:hypothetical protein ANCDUO_18083 [Ancylostoma duodenale]